jgi:diguanylate cyclase (GGDEF)-like protein
MFDIDFFKPYNDNLGHIEGDRALSLVGRITKDNIRKVDLPGRYGGEEFCVILPETSLDYGIEVAEQVRTSVEKETKPPNLAKGITISLGLAELRENNTLTDLIADADSKLYCAKKSGRNKLAY